MADPLLIQELQATQTSNYVIAVGGALVAYDQVLTFSQEVDLVWKRQWSFMTALYLIARHSGSISMVGNAVWSLCINRTDSTDVKMYLAVNCAEMIFFLTMEAILVIRIYALFNQSKKVLIFLTTIYALHAIAVFIIEGLLMSNRVMREHYTSIGPAIGSVVQNADFDKSAFFFPPQDGTTACVVFDTLLLLFALWAFVKHALEAKTLNGGWSINVLVRMLVADHLVYFICYLTSMSLSLVTNYVTEFNLSAILLNYAVNIFAALAVVAGPRMVISLREIENKTRGGGGTFEGALSTIQFGIREPPTQSESVMEEGGGSEQWMRMYE